MSFLCRRLFLTRQIKWNYLNTLPDTLLRVRPPSKMLQFQQLILFCGYSHHVHRRLLSTWYVIWPTSKCYHKGLLGRTRLLFIKDEFIWNQTKVRSIRFSLYERLIDCFQCLNTREGQRTNQEYRKLVASDQ